MIIKPAFRLLSLFKKRIMATKELRQTEINLTFNWALILNSKNCQKINTITESMIRQYLPNPVSNPKKD